jgi:ribose transport system permease protein
MQTTLSSSEKLISRSRTASSFLRNNASVILIYAFVLLIAGIASVYAENFRTPSNLLSILRQSIILGLIAIGQSLVVLTGGMDISMDMVARTVALVVATLFAANNSNPWMIVPLIALGLLIGAILGGMNGLLITRTHANPFIITFGIASLLRGVNLAIATTPIRGIPTQYQSMYTAKIGIVPVCVIVMALIWFLAYMFTTRTSLGRHIFAVGGSERVAQLSGIRVNRTMIATYVLASVFAAAAGLFFLARTGVGDPGTAEGLTFQSVVAVAVGGISLYGGRGSIIGTLGGVLLLSLLSNVFNLMQVSIFYQQLLLGLVVLIAVAAYKSRSA